SFLTAACLDRMKGALLRVALVAFSTATAIYIYITFAVPEVTNASKAVGTFIARNTTPDSVVVTNLRTQFPPYQSWDSAAHRSTGMVSDRLLFFDITSPEGIARIEADLKRNFAKAVFVLDPALDVSSELRDKLVAAGGPVVRGELAI